ncbi:hypothetical protein V6N13_122383 [Hibiscus sabdariffa]
MEFFGSKAGAPPLKFLFSSDGEKPSLEEGSEESAQVLLRPCGGSCNKDSLYLDFVNLKAYLSGLGILSSLSSHFPASNALPPLPKKSHRFGCKLRRTKYSLIRWSKLKSRVNNQKKHEVQRSIRSYQGRKLNKEELSDSKACRKELDVMWENEERY